MDLNLFPAWSAIPLSVTAVMLQFFFAKFKKLAIERSLSIADHRVLQLNFDGLSPMSCRHWECPPVLTFINWTFHSAGVQPLILN